MKFISLIFCAASILVHGLSLELNEAVCTSGIAICIGFYVTSKIFLFLFLSEKVHIVWSSTQGCPRIKSPIYMACMLVILMYTSVGVYLVWERIAYFEDLGRVCIIGLKRLGSVLLLSYDVCSNVTLLIMFLWPLHRARVRNLYLRSIALRAIYATLIMLTSSTVNIVVLTAMDGRETGWVCLVSFSGDIIVNAAVLFWATSGSSLRPAAPAGAIDGAFTPSGAFVGPVCLPTTSECTESTVVISEGDVEEVYGSEWCVSVLPMPISKPCLELSVITEQDEKDMSTMSLEELDEEYMKRE
ncbi:hypothetical protein EUX98_g887 [Antrodiella citrinella]|uniref:Transmembrane protein n=1 Tax=Antrodiella citrinella TaxID=2447956 RepID=A0A4S4N4H1_9APHY|nr:hypothetical protein EUX98_g887 [Antrodiella citrinella]